MKRFAIVAAVALMAAGVTGIATNGYSAPRAASVALGQVVEPFNLPDVNGDTDKDFKVGNWKDAKATVIFFFSTRCPVSKAYNARLVDMAETYKAKGVRFYAINSNAPESNDEVSEYAVDHKYSFPTLKDKGNVIADRFGAEVTPEVFVMDSTGALVYTGQIDDSRDEFRARKRPLKDALESIVANEKVVNSFTRPFGSTIKRADG